MPIIITHCMAVVNRVDDLVEICGKSNTVESRVINAHGILFRLDLCREHSNKLEELERIIK